MYPLDKALKDEARKFGKNVAILGVARIFSTKSVVLRIVWLATILTCTGILFWQLSSLFISFFKWPVDTAYKESDDRSEFPDITVCNLYPLGELGYQNLTWTDYRRFTDRKLSDKAFPTTYGLTAGEFSEIKNVLGYPSMYLANFPVCGGNSSLIQEAKYFNWDGRAMDSTKSVYETTWSAHYYRCHTFRTPNDARALSIILYTDNFTEIMPGLTFSYPTVSQATGVRVAVHPTNSLPDLDAGLSVGSGTETTLRVSQTVRIRKPSPYGSCTDRKYLKDDGDPSKSMVYTVNSCQETCIQQQCIDSCGCLFWMKQFTKDQLRSVNGLVCGNQSMTKKNWSTVNKPLLGMLKCMLSFDPNTTACVEQCRKPCSENEYSVSANSAPWPNDFYLFSFYTGYIQNNSRVFGKKFEAYDKMLKGMDPLSNSTEIVRRLKEVNLIEKNFIRLNIVLDSFRPKVLEDRASFTFDNMLASMGGSMNLWLGLSAMTFIDIVQFVYRVCAVWVKKKLGKEPSNNRDDGEDKVPNGYI